MSVVHEPIEDGVCDSGIAEELMPVFDRELAGDNGGAALRPIFNYFEEVGGLLSGERLHREIIQHQDFDACPSAYSGAIRSPIPDESDHPFRGFRSPR